MVLFLSEEKNLEAVIAAEEDEIKAAIEELTEKEYEDIPEEMTNVIEQQQDPQSFVDTSYSINVEYGDGPKNSYYESVKDAEPENLGASYSTIVTEQESKVIALAEETIYQIREGDISHKPFVALDYRQKDVLDTIKLLHPAWFKVMYEGKIVESGFRLS